MNIRVNINGRDYGYEFFDAETTLLFYLRDVLRVTGTKRGCNEGHCGSCTVILDGKAVLACKTYMRDMNGRSVTTIEALSDGEKVHALVYAFAKEGAVQCGFCTPGFILASKALLDSIPEPSDRDIRKALVRNICRCTGYVKIIEAVRTAAELIKDGRVWIRREEIFPDSRVEIGESVVRIDSIERAGGETVFADDLHLEDMLYAKVLRSDRLHAEILEIDATEAEKSEGVVKVLLSRDIPGKNSFGPIKKDQKVLVDDRVRYLGDAVAAVCAETEEAAAAAVEKIRVSYRDLPPLVGYEEALAEDSMKLHGGEDNLIAAMEGGRGDVAVGFGEADIVLEEEFDTQYIEHAYLEPEACVAEFNGEGELVVYVASQGPPMDIDEISPVLDIPPEKIHIAGMPMGGGFGGKEDISVQIIASLGALSTGRPVKYSFTREESIRTSGKRNAAHLSYKVGVDKSGKLTAVSADVTAKGGAYASVEEAVILRSTSFAAGPYTVPHADIRTRAVYQNHAPTCAMRGFGNPVVTFASETMMNKLADSLGFDPIEFRLKNVLEAGKPTATGDRIEHSVGVEECLVAVRDALENYEMPAARDGWAMGVGVACSYKNVGLGIGMDDSGGARAEILNDGSLLLRIGSVDMGQGANSAMAQILSAELGWPFGRIRVHSADTKLDPRAGMTTASRQTFVTGNAVLEAAKRLKEKIGDTVRAEYGVRDRGIEIKENAVYGADSEEAIVSLEDFIRRLEERGITLFAESRYTAPETHFSLKEPKGGYKSPAEGHLHAAYCFAAQATVLEVHKTSGRVKVHDVFLASDAGRMINRAAVEGQMEGGVVMGLGYALSEEYREEGGRILTDTYAKLGLRRIGETPRIHCSVIENTHPHGPFGAKGMGELPISMGAPTVVHAIHDALGIWIHSLPVVPDKIMRALEDKERTGESSGR